MTSTTGIAEQLVKYTCVLVVQLEAIVRRIMRLTKQPDTKVLVFSTWQDVLELLAHALKANNLPVAHAKGGSKGFDSAIAQFKGSSGLAAPVQTLLLLIKQGSHGLNLTGECRILRHQGAHVITLC